MTKAVATLVNDVGLHARPAAQFVQLAGSFGSTITVRNMTTDGDPANAKSILAVLSVGAHQGHDIEISAEGDDADTAVAQLAALVGSGFEHG